MNEDPSALELRIVTALRAAREPVREVALFERIGSEPSAPDPEVFLAALEKLATLGHVRVTVEHDRPLQHDPEPFQPRFWRVVD